MRDQLVVARVGLRGGAEAGVLAHRPRPAGVHRWVDAPRVGIVAGFTERKIRIEFCQILRPVHGLEWRSRLRLCTHPGILAPLFCALLAQCLIARSAREDRAFRPLPSSDTRGRKACPLVRSSRTATRDPGRPALCQTRTELCARATADSIMRVVSACQFGSWLR